MSRLERVYAVWDGRHRRGWARRLTWSALATVLVAVAAWGIWGRGTSVWLDAERAGRLDAAAFAKLGADLKLVLEWDPPFAQPAACEMLAEWIRMPTNASAQRWEELTRSDVREFARINGMVNLLRNDPGASLEEARKLEQAALVRELRDRFQRIAERRRASSLVKIVQLPHHRLLLERWRVPPIPVVSAESSGWRALWATSPAATRRWAESLRMAIERQIKPVEQLYRAADAKDEIRLGSAGEMQLVLKRLLTRDTQRPTVVYSGTRTLSDWELWVRMRADLDGEQDEPETRVVAGQQHEWDTGLRLVCVPWANVSATADQAAGSLDFRPVWPPDSRCAGCDLPLVNEFLRDSGLPRSWFAANATLHASGDWTQPKIAMRVVLASRQFPNWRSEVEWDLPHSQVEAWRQQVARAAQTARHSLREHVLGLSEYCGFPATFVSIEGDPRAVELKVTHSRWGELRLLGAFDDDGQLDWSPLPPVEDRLKLCEQLVRERPELGPHASRLILTAVQLAPERDEIEVQWKLRPLQGEPREPIQLSWKTDAKSPEPSSASNIVGLPPSLPAPPPPAPPVQLAPGQAKATPADARRAAEAHLASEYSLLNKGLRVVTSPTESGVALHLALKISDWPELSLGPVAAATIAEVPGQIDMLLGRDSVGAAAQEQWHDSKGLLKHGRYGTIHSELADWQPRQGFAKIRSTVKFPYIGDMKWEERAESKLDGAWTKLDEVVLARDLRPDVDQALASAQDEMLSWIGLQGVGRVEVDPQGIEGNRWLTMNPPRISLRCWARVPYLGVKLQAGRCWLDQSGFHAPKELGVAIPGTITLPYFSLSEPAISLGLGERSMTVAGKVTPPSPPGPVNPWLDVGYTELAVGGELHKDGWKRPKLRGTGDLSVAGSTNLAHGGLGVDFGKGDIDGDFLARAPLPGMDTVPARLDGKLAYRGDAGSFDMGGRGTVFDEEIANLNFVMGEKPAEQQRPFDLSGRVRVPYVASLTVDGDAAKKMDRFTLRGKGSSGPFTCRFTATEDGVETETGVENGKGGTTYVDEWDPSLATLNTADPQSNQPPPPTALRQFVEGSPQRSATEAEKKFAAARHSVTPDPDEQGTLRPMVRDSDTPPRAYLEYGRSSMKYDGTTLVVSADNGRVLCRIPAEHRAGIEINRRGINLVTEWATGGGGEILFGQIDQGKWLRISYSADQSTLPASVRTIDSLGIVNSQVDASLPDFPRLRELPWRALKMAFELGVLRSAGRADMLHPQRLAHPEQMDGYSFDLPPRADQPSGLPLNRRWLWFDDGIIQSVDLASPWVSREWENRADFLLAVREAEKGLRAHLQRPILFATVAAVRPPDAQWNEWAFGWVVHRRKDLPRDHLVWRTREGWKQLELADHSLDNHELYSRGQAFARLAWRTPALAGRLGWVGPGGLFIDDDTRYWLIADRGLEQPAAESLSRAGWIDWTAEHSRFLPHAWQTRESRRLVPTDQLARSVLRDWESVRQEPGDFAVHPLGLLMLAGQQERRQAAPPSRISPTIP